MNTLLLVGKVIDVEQSTTSSDIKLAKMKIACPKISDPKDSDVFEVNLWRELADKSYPLNRNVEVKGRLSSNNNTKDGKSYYNVSINAEKVAYLEES